MILLPIPTRSMFLRWSLSKLAAHALLILAVIGATVIRVVPRSPPRRL
jgi:hypothetical protein